MRNLRRVWVDVDGLPDHAHHDEREYTHAQRLMELANVPQRFAASEY
jgi:hypothetical protein